MTSPSSTSGLATPKRYTLGQYLEREERSVHKHEFFNGLIERIPGAKYHHNKIATNVVVALDKQVSALSQHYEVINSDQKIYIAVENVVLYPDALIICEKPEFWNGREDLIVNPLVIVEVVSKNTRSYDRGDKFLLYQMIPSFREYILIEQEKPWVEYWFRQDQETWKTAVCQDLNGAVQLRAVNIVLQLSEVYRHLSFDK